MRLTDEMAYRIDTHDLIVLQKSQLAIETAKKPWKEFALGV